MPSTGYTLEVKVEDPRTNQGVSGVTCTLYEYSAYVTGSDYTVLGTLAVGLTGNTTISGITGRWGLLDLIDIRPGVYTVIVGGKGYPTQQLKGYERYEVGPLIRGQPDYLQMQDETGGTRYVYVTSGGEVISGSEFTGSPVQRIHRITDQADSLTFTGALALAQDGDVIDVAPGVYGEDFIIDKRVRIRGKGNKSTILTGIATLAVHDVEFEALALGSPFLTGTGGTAYVLSGGAYRAEFYDCHIQSQYLQFPDNVVNFHRCQFNPLVTTGWTASGANMWVRMYDCMFGSDLPITGAQTGIYVGGGAKLYMRNGELNTYNGDLNVWGFFVTDSGTKLFLNNVRVISDLGSAIYAQSGATVVLECGCYLETMHPTAPVVSINDDAFFAADQAWLSSKVSDLALSIRTTADTRLSHCHFEGGIVIDDADLGTGGTTHFYGANSIRTNGVAPVTDPQGYRRGAPVSYEVKGVGTFGAGTGTTAATVAVLGISANATVDVTPRASGSTENLTAIPVQDRIYVFRDAPGTDGLQFSWTATWYDTG